MKNNLLLIERVLLKEKENKIMSEFILEEYFNNNEKILSLDLWPLTPQELIYLATDWLVAANQLVEFSSIEIISIFKIRNPLGIFQYFVLDSDFDIMEYILDKHTFTMEVNEDIKNKIINLFSSDDKEAIRKEVINELCSILMNEEKNL